MSVESLEWIKASRSYGHNECVELADAGDDVALRDSKDPDGYISFIPKDAMGDVIAAAKAGGLDHLIATNGADCA